MGFQTARETFETAKNYSTDPAVRALADGLIELTRAIEYELSSVKNELLRKLK